MVVFLPLFTYCISSQPFYLALALTFFLYFSLYQNRSSIVTASKRLLWHLSERTSRRRRKGRRGTEIEDNNTANKATEQEKEKKEDVNRGHFLFFPSFFTNSPLSPSERLRQRRPKQTILSRSF